MRVYAAACRAMQEPLGVYSAGPTARAYHCRGPAWSELSCEEPLQSIQSMNCTAHGFSYTIKVHPFRHLAKVQVAGSNPVSRSNVHVQHGQASIQRNQQHPQLQAWGCSGGPVGQHRSQVLLTRGRLTFALAVELLYRVAVES